MTKAKAIKYAHQQYLPFLNGIVYTTWRNLLSSKKCISAPNFYRSIVYVCYTFAFLFPSFIAAQQSTKSFSIFPIEINGEETSSVRAVTQDQQGYMWIIIMDGLVRYDGYDYKSYQNIPGDSTSIRKGALETLFIDHTGVLWIGANAVLSRYNQDCDCFSHYSFKLEPTLSNPKSKPSNLITAMAEDAQQNLWITTSGGGLYQYQRAGDQFVQFLTDAQNDRSTTPDYFRALLGDRNNNLWIGTGFGAIENGRGLIRFNPQNGETKRYTHDPDDPNSLIDNRISALMEDKQGRIWVGTFKSGLHYFEPDADSITRVVYDKNKPNQPHAPQLEHEVWGHEPFVQILHQDQKGGLWIGTIGKGINHFDATTGQLSFYDPAQLERDLFKSYWTFFEDRQGQLWLGSLSGSLFQMDLFGRNFTIYPDLAAAQRSCESKVEDNVIWIGTLGDGLKRFDFKTGAITQYKHDPLNKNSIGDNFVRGVYADKNNMIWLGLGLEVPDVSVRKSQGGVARLDVSTGTFYHYPVKPHDTIIANETVFTVQEDQEGYLWLGTGLGGIYRSNKNKTDFKPYYFPANQQDSSWQEIAYYIYEAGGKLWVNDEIDSTLYQYNYQEQRFIPFLKGFSTNYIEVDHKGWYWIGTWDNGLIWLNPADKSYTHYTVKDGLPSNHSAHALEGEPGIIWIATQKGMVRFNTATKQFRTNGLPHEYFHESAFKTRDGRLIFGGNKALYTFYPGQANSNPFAPDLLLRSLLISGEPYDLSSYRKESSKPIRLKYHQNDLTFHYNGFHLAKPSKNRYKYMLEPFDKEWVIAGTQRTARYTNLDPGTYTFRFMASNSEGLWSAQPKSITIIIAPFIWTSWWACLIYFTLFVLLTYALYRFQLVQKIARQEALRLQELDTFKTRFYANITHEFRTPLTVIQGMAQEIKPQTDKSAIHKLNLIKNNAKYLLTLVNQMLDLSQVQAGKINIDYKQEDIIPLCNYIVESHISFAKSKQLSLQFFSEEKQLVMDIDAPKLEGILTNLLSNAIKFTPAYGKILVFAKRIKETNGLPALQLMVQDSGVGIPPDQIPHIFDRYYQAASARTGEGSGIGLSLVKELVHLMKGRIQVESQLGTRTSFFIHLPITNNAALVQKSMRPRAGINLPVESVNPLPQENAYSSDRPVVVVIEDNIDVAYYINICLEETYQVMHCPDGPTGLAKAYELIPDLIVSDVMMPGMDGNAVCKQLKTDVRTNHIPIILLTAKASAEDKLVGLRQGADAYLTKPFQKEELLVRLEQLLETRKMLQEKYSKRINVDQGTVASANNIHPFLVDIEQIILAALNNENLSAEDLATKVHLSASQVNRKIKALSGMSTNIFIRSIRLTEAKKMLIDSPLSISEIAYQTGFSSPAYFSQMFKKEFDESPSAFQKRVK